MLRRRLTTVVSAGNVWRALPLDEKERWWAQARKAKAEHKIMYPDYKFKPVHNKNKKKAKDAKPTPTPVSEEDDLRADVVAQLMLDGKKGDDLVAAVRDWESSTGSATPDMSFGLDQPQASSSHLPTFSMDQPHASGSNMPLYNPVPLYAGARRSSSVPPLTAYGHIALPTMPFLVSGFSGGSRVPSPVSHISGMSRGFLGQRRASSVQPIPSQPWGFSTAVFGHQQQHQQHAFVAPSPLPEPDTSLFQSEYMTQGSTVLSGHAPRKAPAFGAPNSLALHISPLEGVSPLAHPSDPYSDFYSATTYSSSSAPSPVSFAGYAPQSQSQHPHPNAADAQWQPSAAGSPFSGSPALTDHSVLADAGVVAPQPLHPSQHAHVDEWAQLHTPPPLHAQAFDGQGQPAPALPQVYEEHAQAYDGVHAQSYEEMVSSMEAEQQGHHAALAHGAYDMFAQDGGVYSQHSDGGAYSSDGTYSQASDAGYGAPALHPSAAVSGAEAYGFQELQMAGY